MGLCDGSAKCNLNILFLCAQGHGDGDGDGDDDGNLLWASISANTDIIL